MRKHALWLIGVTLVVIAAAVLLWRKARPGPIGDPTVELNFPTYAIRSAEEDYHTMHGTYTTDLSALESVARNALQRDLWRSIEWNSGRWPNGHIYAPVSLDAQGRQVDLRDNYIWCGVPVVASGFASIILFDKERCLTTSTSEMDPKPVLRWPNSVRGDADGGHYAWALSSIGDTESLRYRWYLDHGYAR